MIEEAAMAVGSDEEKKAVAQEQPTTTIVNEKAPEGDDSATVTEGEKKKDAALKEQPKMTNTFSWQNINYVISVGGGRKQKLLDDVSGFVSPGKLTALMGESGAGKVSIYNIAWCLNSCLIVLL